MEKVELIDRAAVIDTLRNFLDTKWFGSIEATMHYRDSIEFAMSCINAAPAIDAAPVRRGEWEELVWDDEYDNRKHRSYRCTRCYKQNAVRGNFCPSCGADMRGANE